MSLSELREYFCYLHELSEMEVQSIDPFYNLWPVEAAQAIPLLDRPREEFGNVATRLVYLNLSWNLPRLGGHDWRGRKYRREIWLGMPKDEASHLAASFFGNGVKLGRGKWLSTRLHLVGRVDWRLVGLTLAGYVGQT